jgi:hypothetical protein
LEAVVQLRADTLIQIGLSNKSLWLWRYSTNEARSRQRQVNRDHREGACRAHQCDRPARARQPANKPMIILPKVSITWLIWKIAIVPPRNSEGE